MCYTSNGKESDKLKFFVDNTSLCNMLLNPQPGHRYLWLFALDHHTGWFYQLLTLTLRYIHM